ncbi:hypothetical protein CONCODRAFT_80282 [Conidiobolus coronatus NRRL 28638]|uniref:Uncharacterized protein n=1 Tax=Conidiobolus coronatus (strain ATCC 28846 / CBS 209.66 / NRRL 28638) TaxID=796925 RepID=A0A137NWQ1_CONC2|nr:hypothetical protein CONCODRAFT_80282 [Conidiobolus coronatus NRRL 28638]|eukprot:KXN67091.1 hypothetical protein CONCODRAFT_80282 [Conidiobolus coronatus NRRL 28638]
MQHVQIESIVFVSKLGDIKLIVKRITYGVFVMVLAATIIMDFVTVDFCAVLQESSSKFKLSIRRRFSRRVLSMI